MGNIRGKHVSPGVYTRSTFDGLKKDTRNNRKGNQFNPNESGGSWPRPDYWMLGDETPIVLS